MKYQIDLNTGLPELPEGMSWDVNVLSYSISVGIMQGKNNCIEREVMYFEEFSKKQLTNLEVSIPLVILKLSVNTLKSMERSEKALRSYRKRELRKKDKKSSWWSRVQKHHADLKRLKEQLKMYEGVERNERISESARKFDGSYPPKKLEITK